MFGFYINFSGTVIKIKKLQEYHMSEKKKRIDYNPISNIKNNEPAIISLIFIFNEDIFLELSHDSLNII